MIGHYIFYLMVFALLVAVDVFDLTTRKKYSHQAAVRESLQRLWKSLASSGVLGYLSGYNTPAFVIAMGALFIAAAIVHVGAARVAKMPIAATAPDGFHALTDFLGRLPPLGLVSITVPGPVAVAGEGLAVEHRPQIIVHREQGGGGSDSGDADHHTGNGDHVEQVVENRDGAHHGAGSSWEDLYKQLQALRAEFYAIKEGKEHDSIRRQT